MSPGVWRAAPPEASDARDGKALIRARLTKAALRGPERCQKGPPQEEPRQRRPQEKTSRQGGPSVGDSPCRSEPQRGPFRAEKSTPPRTPQTEAIPLLQGGNSYAEKTLGREEPKSGPPGKEDPPDRGDPSRDAPSGNPQTERTLQVAPATCPGPHPPWQWESYFQSHVWGKQLTRTQGAENLLGTELLPLMKPWGWFPSAGEKGNRQTKAGLVHTLVIPATGGWRQDQEFKASL